MGAYALSKTALLGLSKLMAMELGPRGIRVNCICPGLIETRFGNVVKTFYLRLQIPLVI
jgi:NAD(P)-dependent dehydrogenase (short-subunit alcohol dehydrogenase family)